MKRSTSFGLNQVDPNAYNGWAGFLNGCWSDADKMAALMGTAGYEARAFFDAECTMNRLRQQLEIAARVSEAGDTFYFSFSGHGTQSLGVWFSTEEGMACYDGILGDSEFRELLAQFKPGTNVVVDLDICHAGGLDRAFGQSARVAPLWSTRGKLVTPKAIVDVPANLIIRAACLRDELSGDVQFNGVPNGAYTGSLLETMDDGMSWRQWLTATQRYMSNRFPTQHPELIEVGGSGMADQVV